MMVAKQCYLNDGWQLSALLRGIAELGEHEDVTILGLASDSRRVGPGDLFFACQGNQAQGHAYISEAIKYGAVAVVYDAAIRPIDLMKNRVPTIAVADLGGKVGLIADRFYHHPSHDLHVTGVTGTNGKTSCSHIIAHALSKGSAMPAGLIGTLGNGLCGDLKPSTHTTPDPISLQVLLREMRDAGAKEVVMEVSSHGLDQGRVNGVEIEAAVYTNITRDHLDYHQTMAAYVAAKKRLFMLPTLRYAVINLDDAYSHEIVAALNAGVAALGFTLQEATSAAVTHPANLAVMRATVIKNDRYGAEVQVKSPYGKGLLVTSLLGLFNIRNLLASLALLLLRGIALEEALARLATTRPLPGRMETFDSSGAAPLLVVDYAHTPDALENVLVALRQFSTGKLWCVFGCGGDRDTGKRPMMGAIAGRYADHVVVTDDNPRSEEPQAIVAAILAGVPESVTATVIHDRTTAIRYAFTHAAAQDTILIAGKGHEEYQEIRGQRYPYSDRQVVATLLGKTGGACL